MSRLEKIDDKKFVIKYNGKINGGASFAHMFCDWSLKCVQHHRTTFKAGLKCTANGSNLWKVNAEVTFKFIKSDGTEGCKETVNVVYQHDKSEVCNVTALVQSDYVNEDKYAVDCYVKIKSIIGLSYKMHDFTKSDDIINNTALIVEEKKLYVNKMILANASPVFHAMFFSGFKESTADEIPIGYVKYDEFEQFLQLIYGCYIYIGKSTDSLLQIADRFDVRFVRTQCEDYLIANGKWHEDENLIRAEKYALSRLQVHILDTIEGYQLKSFCNNSAKFGEATIRALAKKLSSQ